MKMEKFIIIHRTLLTFAFFTAMLVAPLSFADEQKSGMLATDQVLVELSSQESAKTRQNAETNQQPATTSKKPARKTDRKRNGKLRTRIV